MDTAKILQSGSLKAATAEDEEEMNAVECALMPGASRQVVGILQRASQRVMRRTKMMNDKTMSSNVPTVSPHQMGVARPRLTVHFMFKNGWNDTI